MLPRELSRIIIALVLLAAFPAFAQTAKPSSSGTSKASKVLGGQLTTILEYGLAGGVLGLSTLSFYGRPQDKLSHIPVGMALGIIAGTVFSTSQMVSQPPSEPPQSEFRSVEPSPPLALQWTFHF